MYTQMSHNHAVYNGVPSAPYHYDRSLRVSHHEYDSPLTNTTTYSPPPHPNDPYWYSEPAAVPSQHISKSMASHHYPLLFSPVSSNGGMGSGGPRPVIPSKRAAQNRAAQRAFRLRKERYVKDLEQKAKLMDDMKAELDQLRKENQMLKNTTLKLEKHISGAVKTESLIEPLNTTSFKSNEIVQQQQQQRTEYQHHHYHQHQQRQLQQQQVEIIEEEFAEVAVVEEQQEIMYQYTNKQRQKKRTHSVSPIQTHFQPVSLRAPDQPSFGSPTTSCSSSSSFTTGSNHESQTGGHYWPTTTTATAATSVIVPPDFEAYECMPNMDDLCGHRQRSDMSSFVMVPPYPMVHENNMLMSRSF